jgi:WD40 repeat protein
VQKQRNQPQDLEPKPSSAIIRTDELRLFGRLQSRWATYCFWKWRQVGEGAVRVSARKEVVSLAGHTDYVMSVAFSPDGQHFASGSGDNLI